MSAKISKAYVLQYTYYTYLLKDVLNSLDLILLDQLCRAFYKLLSQLNTFNVSNNPF